MLTFDEATHTYYWNGVQVPNITSVLKEWVECSPYKDAPDARFFVNTWDGATIRGDIFDEKRGFGQAVHKMAAIMALGGRVQLTTDNELLITARGALEKAFELYGLRADERAVETPMYSEKYGYAGTPDLPCRMNLNKRMNMVEWKTSLKAPTGGPQTAAQEQLFRETFDYRGLMDRWIFYLPKKAKEVRVEKLDDRRDWPRYKNKLTEHNIRMEG